jgi:hypothetical protein
VDGTTMCDSLLGALTALKFEILNLKLTWLYAFQQCLVAWVQAQENRMS